MSLLGKSKDDAGRDVSSGRLQKILKKVKQIEVLTRGSVQGELAGEYHSSFRGQGIDFDEFREYQPGDDVGAIDWNVTARSGVTHIKKFIEDRELLMVLVVDVSGSGSYGSIEETKRELAAEVAALFAFSAVQNQDQVAMIMFSDEVELLLPPKKGRSHCLRMIRDILVHKHKGKGTDLAPAMEALMQLVDRRSLVVLISDFQTDHTSQVEEALKLASVKHDLVAVQVSDPNEETLPSTGWVTVEDPETGEQVQIDSSSSRLRREYEARVMSWRSELVDVFRRRGVDHLNLKTGEDCLPAIHGFFRRRSGVKG